MASHRAGMARNLRASTAARSRTMESTGANGSAAAEDGPLTVDEATGLPSQPVLAPADPLSTLVHQLLTNLIGDALPMWSLHSDPGNYAFGQTSFDNIITQLLNQFDHYGAPPANPIDVESLPRIQVTDEQVAEATKCLVCFEEFKLEEVRQLPCQHIFHDDCILPWLRQHGTCPICRKSLSTENTTRPTYGLGTFHQASPSSSRTVSDPHVARSNNHRGPPYHGTGRPPQREENDGDAEDH